LANIGFSAVSSLESVEPDSKVTPDPLAKSDVVSADFATLPNVANDEFPQKGKELDELSKKDPFEEGGGIEENPKKDVVGAVVPKDGASPKENR